MYCCRRGLNILRALNSSCDDKVSALRLILASFRSLSSLKSLFLPVSCSRCHVILSDMSKTHNTYLEVNTISLCSTTPVSKNCVSIEWSRTRVCTGTFFQRKKCSFNTEILMKLNSILFFPSPRPIKKSGKKAKFWKLQTTMNKS